MRTIIGWDIGGAHLKAAAVVDGRLVSARQQPCPLWQGMDRLRDAFAAIAPDLPPHGAHAVTMTGELVDLFGSRAEGVAKICACAAAALGGEIHVYAGRAGFVPPRRAEAHVEDIAAANWHATASLCARVLKDGVLIDIGSTTTDIIPFSGGAVRTRGYDDTARLLARELVYTAAVRTPVMAVARDALFGSDRIPLMAEFFATMADIYRLSGELPGDADQGATADGRGKSQEESAARLARMIGRNLDDAPMTAWIAMAQDLRRSQIETLAGAARTVIATAGLPPGAPVVAAGAGAFLAEAVAASIGRPALAIAGAVIGAGPLARQASVCAPAVAVALLLQTAGLAGETAA